MKLKDYKYILLTLFIVISLTMRIYAVNDSVSMIVDTLSLKSPQLVSTEQPDSLSPLIYILPQTPQASALSRYGEIPVNLSTGVPNISIPLYNIKAGNYTLPISISYHASGIKTDDVATCVGLGWVLNAGGAITRTVRGLPDLKNGDMNQDTLYWSYKRCYEASKNIDEVSNIIAMDIDHPQMHDTESDRYIYNFADKTGVFVYSLADKAFVPLNYQPFLIYAEGGENSSFSIADTDGTEYFFTQQEKTGFADDEGQIGVSAWYLTRIHAEGGDINIRYNEFEPFYMYTVSQSIEVGERVIWNEASNNPDQTIISVGTLQTSKPRKYKYSQVFPIEITWNGNRISFEYLNDREDPGITRLVKMSVSNNLGETVKTVDFNVCYVGGKLIENGSIYTNKRMLLESVDLSDEGKYSFTYNRNTNLPYYELHGKASELHASKDYWGYYNGYKKGCGIPLGVVKDAYLCYTTSSFWHQKFDYYEIEDSRYPSLEYAQMLILKGITYPTGGTTSFTYELNTPLNSFGGLRIKQISSCALKKSYTYKNNECFDSVENFMWRYNTCFYWGNFLGYQKSNFITCSDIPSFPYCNNSSYSVFYPEVTVTYENGEHVVYEYNKGVCYDRSGTTFAPVESKLTLQPSPDFSDAAVNDEGNIIPNLVCKTYYDKDNYVKRKETFEYDKVIVKKLSTGTRVYSPMVNLSEVKRYYTLGGFRILTVYFDVVCRETYGWVKHFNLMKRTLEDFTTGFTTSESYTYDDKSRTLLPKSISRTNSDGIVQKTVYRYVFESDDPVNRNIYENYIMPDKVISTEQYYGDEAVSSTKTEYKIINDFVYPARTYKSFGSGSYCLDVEYSDYGAKGNLKKFIKNTCDTVSVVWDCDDIYPMEVIKSGMLVFSYKWCPLKGIASIKTSNGYEILYKYDEAARLKQMEDHNGIYEQYEYSVRNSYKVKHGTNSVKTTRWLDEKGHNLLSKYIVYDRFGRPFDEATNGVNESGKYVHTFSTYDNKNRVYRKWLPVVGTTAFSEPTEGDIIDFSRSTYGEDNTCNTMTYDAIDSPVFQTTAGCDWKGKGKATKYVSNTESDVRLFHASMTKNSLVDDGFYLPNMLSGEKHTDEDGHSITVFKDKLGRKVLERRSNGMNNNDTYFVYNGLGQLRYVLSPEYQKAGYKDMYAYEYRYDERGNIVKKILPGCEYIQYWYDRGNRLTFVQDATLRERGLYRFLLYDKLGRLAVQGTCKTCSRGEQPNIVEFEKNNTGICNTGYKITLSDKITNPNLEVVNYYDDYSFITRYTDVAGAVSSDMKTEASCATGLQTGSLQVASNGDRILTATYYDKKGQVADIRKLYVDKRFTHIHTAYSYTGNPISIDLKEYAIGDNGKTLTVSQNQTNVYSDKTDKLISVTVTINGKTSTVQKLEYSDLGRIKSITRGGNAGTIVYSYNIHGWQTSISSGDFSEELHYTDGAGTPCYNGNISSLQWTASDYDQKRGYKFTYDALDRLTEAVYGERDNFEDKLNRYNEKVIEYSENGAIKRFQRRGLKDDGVYGKIDNLHVYYNGNRLKRVVDDALPVNRYSSSSFIDGVDDDIEYTYNGVGALTSDKNRGITNIEYDNWNTPATIAFKDGTSISYCYLPDGTKLNSGCTFMSGCVCIDKGLVEYSSNIIYRNGKLSEVLLPNGYCTFDKGNTPVFHYFTRDHLGNNRTVVNENGTVEQIVHYYPFGGIFNDSGLNVELQHYKYNGKELDMTGGLNTYDYGARQYFSPLPVWDRMDEKCEENYNVSPYVYCRDNPIFFFDDNGKDGIVYVIGNDISIYVNILFWGKGATEKNIKIIKNDINRLWNKEWKYYSLDTQKEYNVSFNVNVGIFYDTFEEPNEKNSDVFDSESNNNYIELFNSTPDDKTSITIGGKRGRWRSEGLSNNNVNDDPAPHEFGHLLGLKDKYFVDKNNVAHEYDGYVGDIMATPYPNGNVQQKEINGILDQIKFTIDYEQIYKIHFNNPHDF